MGVGLGDVSVFIAAHICAFAWRGGDDAHRSAKVSAGATQFAPLHTCLQLTVERRLRIRGAFLVRRGALAPPASLSREPLLARGDMWPGVGLLPRPGDCARMCRIRPHRDEQAHLRASRTVPSTHGNKRPFRTDALVWILLCQQDHSDLYRHPNHGCDR